MGFASRVNDWQVAGVAQVGGAAVVGGGVFWFDFRSSAARVQHEMFMFIAFGLGAGGSIGGASMTPGSPNEITCDQPFSVYDLDMSPGRVTIAAAGLIAGYGLAYISAFNLSGPLFTSQDVSGWAAGVSLNAMTTVGYWRSMTLGARAAAGSLQYRR